MEWGAKLPTSLTTSFLYSEAKFGRPKALRSSAAEIPED